MTRSPASVRRIALFGVLVATVVVASFGPEDEIAAARTTSLRPTGVPETSARHPQPAAGGVHALTASERRDFEGRSPVPDGSARRAALDALDTDLVGKRGNSVAGQDLFASRTWQLAIAPQRPAKEAVRAPEAPPLPFRHLGAIQEAGTRVATHFLLEGDHVLLVVEGDKIGSQYRFEGQSGNQVHFLYLPLDIRQSLPISGAP